MAPPSPSANGVAEEATPLERQIHGPADIEQVRREARRLALALGFDAVGAEEIALAVSELATNLLHHACEGVVTITRIERPRSGVRVESRDTGPGIGNLDRALEDGFSTSGSLGGGLGAVRRLMDEFEIASGTDGTRIVAHKWLPER